MQIIPVWGFYIVEISTFQQSSLLARPKYTYYNGYLTITLHNNTTTTGLALLMSKALLYHLLNKQVVMQSEQPGMELMKYSLDLPCLMMVLTIIYNIRVIVKSDDR